MSQKTHYCERSQSHVVKVEAQIGTGGKLTQQKKEKNSKTKAEHPDIRHTLSSGFTNIRVTKETPSHVTIMSFTYLRRKRVFDLNQLPDLATLRCHGDCSDATLKYSLTGNH